MRLSEAFPPEKTTSSFVAEIHKELGSKKHELLLETIEFRTTVTENDVQTLMDFHDECFPIKYPKTFYKKIIDGEMNIILIEGYIRFKDEDMKKWTMLGFLTYKVKESKPEYLSFWKRLKYVFNPRECVHICTLGVLYEFRAHGLGSMLMLKFFSLTRKPKNQSFDYYILEVVKYNESAIKYYLKHGFKKVEDIKNYYFIDMKPYDCVKLIKYIN